MYKVVYIFGADNDYNQNRLFKFNAKLLKHCCEHCRFFWKPFCLGVLVFLVLYAFLIFYMFGIVFVDSNVIFS